MKMNKKMKNELKKRVTINNEIKGYGTRWVAKVPNTAAGRAFIAELQNTFENKGRVVKYGRATDRKKVVQDAGIECVNPGKHIPNKVSEYFTVYFVPKMDETNEKVFNRRRKMALSVVRNVFNSMISE